MRHWLSEIPDLCAELQAKNASEEVTARAEVRETLVGWQVPEGWHPPLVLARVVQVEQLVVAGALPAAVTPGQARGGRVSGSPEPRLPVDVDALDLLAAPRSVRRAVGPDDTGFLPVASTLDFWVQDLRDHRARGEGLPEPSVTVLARWLADRLDEAVMDWYPIDEFAEDLRRAHGALRRLLGLVEPRKEEVVGIPCPSCDLRLLVRLPSSAYVECEACGQLLTEEEYAAWCKALVAASRKSVTPQT